MLTNPRYGGGFPASALASLSLYSSYCAALEICLSPLLDQQQEDTWIRAGQRRWPVERNAWVIENRRLALRYGRLGFIIQSLL